MVFKCFSCATDPTCCLCAQCFQGSDCAAKGHAYKMFKAGSGGCCDCGDREAWDPAGAHFRAPFPVIMGIMSCCILLDRE